MTATQEWLWFLSMVADIAVGTWIAWQIGGDP